MDRVFLLVVGLWSVLAVTGCSSMTTNRKAFKVATPQNPAVKCLCLWQQAEGTTADGKSCRGFAGQVFFMPAEGEVPVVTHGDVRIFAFDNVGQSAAQSRPINQLSFSDAEWQATVTDTQFGPAYNVFVPYTREGNYEVDCALRLRLKRPDGSELFSDMASVKLNGVTRKPTRDADSLSPRDPNGKQRDERQANRDSDSESDSESESGLRSTTIGVERDGQMFRATNRVRKIQIGPAHEDSIDDLETQRAELDAKLRRLQADGQIRRIGATK